MEKNIKIFLSVFIILSFAIFVELMFLDLPWKPYVSFTTLIWSTWIIVWALYKIISTEE